MLINMPDLNSILVVIPTLNEEKTIVTVIKQLNIDLPEEFSIKFVVVDGGSSDNTIKAVEEVFSFQENVYILHNPAKIQSAAVNLAVKTYGHNAALLVRCDAHASYSPGFIKQLVATAKNRNADSVVVVMDSVGVKGLQNAIAVISDTFLGSGGSAHRGGARSGFVDHGHHALMRMAAFQRLGGYDETFTHNEDAEFDCRLRALGGTIYLDSSIRLAYSPRDSFSALWRQYYAYGRGRSRTVRKHPHSLRLRQLAVATFLVTTVLLIPFAFWQPLVLIPGLIYIAILVVAAVHFTLKKRRVSCMLTGPAAFVMHTSWASGFIIGFFTARSSKWTSDIKQSNIIN